MKASPYPFWSVGIVIPARNEQETIDACIDSIVMSCRHARLTDFRIVIVADSCTDSTAERARRALCDVGELIECTVKSAGAARRLGV